MTATSSKHTLSHLLALLPRPIPSSSTSTSRLPYRSHAQYRRSHNHTHTQAQTTPPTRSLHHHHHHRSDKLVTDDIPVVLPLSPNSSSGSTSKPSQPDNTPHNPCINHSLHESGKSSSLAPSEHTPDLTPHRSSTTTTSSTNADPSASSSAPNFGFGFGFGLGDRKKNPSKVRAQPSAEDVEMNRRAMEVLRASKGKGVVAPTEAEAASGEGSSVPGEIGVEGPASTLGRSTSTASASTSSPSTPTTATPTPAATLAAKRPGAGRTAGLRGKKNAITLTPTAVERLKDLANPSTSSPSASPSGQLIRISVRNRGCAGLSYHLSYVSPDSLSSFDEVVDQDGVRVLIDSRALFSVIGSEMDWVEDRMSARFAFKNPNVKDSCGCGESFHV